MAGESQVVVASDHRDPGICGPGGEVPSAAPQAGMSCAVRHPGPADQCQQWLRWRIGPRTQENGLKSNCMVNGVQGSCLNGRTGTRKEEGHGQAVEQREGEPCRPVIVRSAGTWSTRRQQDADSRSRRARFDIWHRLRKTRSVAAPHQEDLSRTSKLSDVVMPRNAMPG